MFNSSSADRLQPPTSIVHGPFLTLLAIQFIAIGLGLVISRDLYSRCQGIIEQQERVASRRLQIDGLSERLGRLYEASVSSDADLSQTMRVSAELHSVVAGTPQLLDSSTELPSQKAMVQERVAALNSLVEARRDGRNKSDADVTMAIARLEWALDGLRTGIDGFEEENLNRLHDFRRVSSWNMLCEALAFLLMVFAIGWTAHLYRRLRKEELARYSIQLELRAERIALEKRVQTRTAALEAEVTERLRAERLNRGRGHMLEMVARNEPVAEILQVLANTLAEYCSTWACAVHTLNAGQLTLTASSGLSEKVMQHLRAISTQFSGAPESVALTLGKPYLIEDLGNERRTWSELLRAHGPVSVRSAPFFTPDACALGTITIYALLRWNPSSADIEMLESAINMAALVLERSRMQVQLVQHAYHDSLTGLPNRRLGRDRLAIATSRAERAGNRMVVLWIDLDRFKQINDQHGHPVGDAVLQTAAQRLSGRLRASDTVARMGGDEFMAVLEGVQGREEAEAVAADLRRILAEPMQIGELKLSLTASIGISLFPEDGMSVDSLAQHADQAMYASKFSSRRLLSYSQEMDLVEKERRTLEDEMSLALVHGGFSLAYQPICTPDGKLNSFEALLRFHSPSMGDLSPSYFVPIAEERHLIVPIGEWVLREVCRQAREWRVAGLPDVLICVNISALQFTRGDFADTVSEILDEVGIAGSNIVLELTESIVMHDYLESARQMNRLKKLGVRIAIDDFGTGYSSLSCLHRLPIDVLKIDRSFIENMNGVDGTLPIVEAVLSMANTLGLEVVAEGVETAEQLSVLETCGCAVIQGYFFSKPVGHASAAEFLRSGSLVGSNKSSQAEVLSIVAKGAA